MQNRWLFTATAKFHINSRIWFFCVGSHETMVNVHSLFNSLLLRIHNFFPVWNFRGVSIVYGTLWNIFFEQFSTKRPLPTIYIWNMHDNEFPTREVCPKNLHFIHNSQCIFVRSLVSFVPNPFFLAYITSSASTTFDTFACNYKITDSCEIQQCRLDHSLSCERPLLPNKNIEKE